MEPYQARVVVEKADLDEKIYKLVAYLGSNPPPCISAVDTDLMTMQLGHMRKYSAVLGMRIHKFSVSQS